MNKDSDFDTGPKAPGEEMEYIFDRKMRKASRGTILTFVAIGALCLLIALILGLIWLFNGRMPEETINGALILLMIGCIAFLYPAQERRRFHWLLGKCRINENGIYIHLFRENVEFVSWSSIIDIEHKQMNIDSLTHVSVICCYKSLAGKTLLDHAPKIGEQNSLYKEFYQLRDEVITIGYTKDRMHQIRTFLKKNADS